MVRCKLRICLFSAINHLLLATPKNTKIVADLAPKVELLENAIEEEKADLKEVKEKQEENLKMIQDLLNC